MRLRDEDTMDELSGRRARRAARAARSSVRAHLEPEPFRVEIHPERDRVRVAPIGELDLLSVGVVEEQLVELHDAGFDHIVVDLHRVSFLDSTGLRVLLAAAQRARQADRRLRVVGARRQVLRLCELTGVSSRLGLPSPDPAPSAAQPGAAFVR